MKLHVKLKIIYWKSNFTFIGSSYYKWVSLVAQTIKNLPIMQETQVQSLGQDPLKKEMATHSSILAWRIAWTEGFCFRNFRMPKPLTVWITIHCGKFFKRWEYQTTWLASWESCMQVRKQQLVLDMEQQTGSKLEKEYIKAVYVFLLI